LLAAMTTKEEATNQVYNVAVGDRTTLNELYSFIRGYLAEQCELIDVNLIYRDFRAGDVRHSQADISKAQSLLGYHPSHRTKEGLNEAMKWYVDMVERGH